MQSNDNETVVDKAVNFVKDALGIQRDPVPEIRDEKQFRDAEPEVAAEDAMKLDPNPYINDSAGQLTPGTYPRPASASDAERLRREVDEHPEEKTPMEYNADLVRRENGI